MNMRKILAVAQREYVETIKTKVFMIGLLLMPVLILGISFLSTKLVSQPSRPDQPTKLAVVDRTGLVGNQLIELMTTRYEPRYGQRMEILIEADAEKKTDGLEPIKQRVRDGRLFALLEVPADVIDGGKPCILHARGGTIDDFRQRKALRQVLSVAVSQIRFQKAGLDADQIMELSRPIPLSQHDVAAGRKQATSLVGSIITPLAFMFLLYFGIVGVSQGLLTSVVEEKSSRVIEVLLSALSPGELMTGKIIGLTGVGFTLILTWTTTGYIAAVYKGMTDLIQINDVGHFVLYYVLGFLLISSMLAAIGSACNTLKEAQSLMTPVMLIFVIPLVMWMYISQHPNAMLSTIMTFIPPMTPIVMILRLTSPAVQAVPLWQQIVVPLWLVACVIVTLWAAAKIFRVGILMYGKPPTLAELARWVRHR